jgi:hypothetical protein
LAGGHEEAGLFAVQQGRHRRERDHPRGLRRARPVRPEQRRHQVGRDQRDAGADRQAEQRLQFRDVAVGFGQGLTVVGEGAEARHREPSRGLPHHAERRVEQAEGEVRHRQQRLRHHQAQREEEDAVAAGIDRHPGHLRSGDGPEVPERAGIEFGPRPVSSAKGHQQEGDRRPHRLVGDHRPRAVAVRRQKHARAKGQRLAQQQAQGQQAEPLLPQQQAGDRAREGRNRHQRRQDQDQPRHLRGARGGGERRRGQGQAAAQQRAQQHGGHDGAVPVPLRQRRQLHQRIGEEHGGDHVHGQEGGDGDGPEPGGVRPDQPADRQHGHQGEHRGGHALGQHPTWRAGAWEVESQGG